MALNVFELFGTIAIDNSGAERSLDKTVGHAKNAESKLEKTFKKIGTVVAAAFAIDKIADFGKACTEAYASIAAEESAFTQIMGDYAGTAQQKLQAVSDATGVTSTRMTGAMTSLTAKFKGLGYDVEDATTLATDGLLIASDAAAFWDMSLDESMSHLNSFINGSYEGGEAIGLFANDTQMAAYAVEKGIVADAKAWASLDEATKQATRLDYAKNMQQQSGATGQAAKEASSYANVMANLKEHWRQFLGIVGKPILEKVVLPAVQKLNEFMPKLNESVQNGIEWLSEGFDKIASYFSDVFTEDGLKLDALPNALRNMFRDVARKIPALLSNIGRTIRDAWANTVWPAVQGAFMMALGIDLPEWSEIESAVVNWWDGGNGIKAAIAAACNWTLNLFGKPADVTQEDVSNVLDSWWASTVPFVQNACTWVLNLFSNPTETMEQVRSKIGEWWSSAKGWVSGACSWALNLFENPVETAEQVKNKVAEWWAIACGWVANACGWALNLFGAPADATEDDITKTLSAWWEKAKSLVASACAWVLNPFGAPDDMTQLDVKAVLQPWWMKAVSLVKEACAWALNLFEAPEDLTGDDVSSVMGTWWTNAVKLVQDTCTWVLQLFGAPKELTESDIETLIGTWWTNAVTLVEDACAWVLNLFGEPETLTAETVEGILSTWWTSAKALVQNACSWVLQLFTNPTESQETIIKYVSTWWASVGNVIAGACSWVLQLFGVPQESTEDIKSKIQTWWDGIKNNFANLCGVFFSLFTRDTNDEGTTWADLLKTWFDSVVAYAGDVFNIVVSVVGGWISSARNTITSWWDTVKSGLALTVNATVQPVYDAVHEHTAYQGGYGAAAGSTHAGTLGAGGTGMTTFFGDDEGMGGLKIPGFATGLDYVPRDNYLARLHQGEAVLTRNEADAWRSGGGSKVDAALAQMASLLQEIAQNTGADRPMVLDTGVLVGQLAPGIDARLGTFSNRKGRGN